MNSDIGESGAEFLKPFVVSLACHLSGWGSGEGLEAGHYFINVLFLSLL